MSLTRIYQSCPLAVNQQLTLDEAASHHLARVLRSSVNDQITLFNGDNTEFTAIITAINKKNVRVMIQAQLQRDVEAPIAIYLAQGIARGEKMDFIIQKAVELGVAKIFPLLTERCNVRLNQEREEKRLRHWQSIVISACEQSGRNRLPELLPAQSLLSFVAHTTADVKFVLSPHADMSLSKPTVTAPSSILLLLGPEGGLSPEEITLVQKHDFQAIKLGPRVLRTETATIAAITSILCRFGDY